jgi:hypothetical protein
MPYIDPRPLPVNPEWKIDVYCPHGVLIHGSLDLVRSYQELVDPCPAAAGDRAKLEAERAARKAKREESELYQLWLALKFRRQLRRFHLDTDPDPDDPTEIRPR